VKLRFVRRNWEQGRQLRPTSILEAVVTDVSRKPNDTPAAVSMEEIDAETSVALPNKEVLSLLDVNANVDLGLDLAAPVDLAAAANLNVAAPIEAAASANLLSPDAQAVSLAHQSGSLSQTLSGSADATAPQQAEIAQDSGGGAGTTPDGAAADGTGVPSTGDLGSTAGDITGGTGGTDATTGDVTGGVENLLNGGSLLNADINLDANANLTAPIDGAVAANANVAAPVDAAVAANIGSAGATAEALAPQELDISQTMDNVSADATAAQDANVSQS
jgi:hypothetical protein